MTPKQLAFKAAVENIIKKLALRNMEGYFFEDCNSCVKEIIQIPCLEVSTIFFRSKFYMKILANALK